MIAASPPSLLLKTPLEKREYLMDPFTGGPLRVRLIASRTVTGSRLPTLTIEVVSLADVFHHGLGRTALLGERCPYLDAMIASGDARGA